MKTYGYLEHIKVDKFLILLPFLTITTRLIIFIFIPHTYEDAFITFRYAENLANGFGLVYNIGEKVYGTTTPLFAIILALFKLIGISCVVSSLAINLISDGITSLIVYKFLKDYSKGIITVFVSLMFVFSPSNISWSIHGMETPFFGAFIALSFYCLYKEKYFAALLFGFLSAMIRIDGLSVALIVSFFTIIKLRSQILKKPKLFLPLAFFAGWLLFLYLYYGNFLPNSMIAKLILYSGHQTSIWPNVSEVLSKFFIVGYYTSTLITILFLSGVLLIFFKKIKLYPMVTWFFLYYLALILSKTTIHGWYLIPPLFVFIIISGIAIITLFDFVTNYIRIKKSIILLAVFMGVIFFSAITLSWKIIQISDEYDYELNVRIKIGEFINKNTPENARVFLEPIGVIGYFSERYIYDDAALISPVFLELNKLPNTAETIHKKIQLVRPDYLVIRNKYLEEFYSTTNLLEDYTSLKSFDYHKDPDFPSMTIFERKSF